MPQDTESRRLDKFIVRLPEGMRDRLAAAAKANGRSMNAQIVTILEEWFNKSDVLINYSISYGEMPAEERVRVLLSAMHELTGELAGILGKKKDHQPDHLAG
jgi:hypothetical protein